MPDREKVAKALKLCARRKPGEYDCHKCPYETRIDGDGCEVNVMLDAADLLKEQKPEFKSDMFFCRKCKNALARTWAFCPKCGRAVKWNG